MEDTYTVTAGTFSKVQPWNEWPNSTSATSNAGVNPQKQFQPNPPPPNIIPPPASNANDNPQTRPPALPPLDIAPAMNNTALPSSNGKWREQTSPLPAPGIVIPLLSTTPPNRVTTLNRLNSFHYLLPQSPTAHPSTTLLQPSHSLLAPLHS